MVLLQLSLESSNFHLLPKNMKNKFYKMIIFPVFCMIFKLSL
jgi:hypothetical protein